MNIFTSSSSSSSSQMSVYSAGSVSSSPFSSTSTSDRLLSAAATSSSRSNKGRFYSPQYPSTYPKGIKCSYTFTGLFNQRVRLVFEHIMLLKSDLRYLQYYSLSFFSFFLSFYARHSCLFYSFSSCPMKGNSCTVKSFNHMSNTSSSSLRTNLISQVNFKVPADLLFFLFLLFLFLFHSLSCLEYFYSPSTCS